MRKILQLIEAQEATDNPEWEKTLLNAMQLAKDKTTGLARFSLFRSSSSTKLYQELASAKQWIRCAG